MLRNLPANDFGHIDVNLVSLRGSTPLVLAGTSTPATDLTASKHFIAPDDGNPEDETVMAVPLPQPVAPGGSVTIEVKWTAHIPRTFARTGALGNFFFVGQWFPKLGVLQDNGWNCHQFHSSTEFFSDYGVYDVSLTVPRGWTLGATGIQRERRDNADNTTTHQYTRRTSRLRVDDEPRFHRADRALRTPDAPPVEMRLLLQPEHAGQADRHFDATRTALSTTASVRAYPCGHITIVDPPIRAARAGWNIRRCSRPARDGSSIRV